MSCHDVSIILELLLSLLLLTILRKKDLMQKPHQPVTVAVAKCVMHIKEYFKLITQYSIQIEQEKGI